jgi:hypothetical protein
MTKSKGSLKNKHVTVRMTSAMYANLMRLSGTNRQMADVIREAIRQYLDNQGEIAGSRRYFTGRFREEVRALRRELSWHQTLNTILLAEMFSLLIINLIDMDDKMAQQFSASGILKIAEERLVESGWKVRLRIEAASDDAQIVEQRRKDLADG